jgi:hypothetical protein
LRSGLRRRLRGNSLGLKGGNGEKYYKEVKMKLYFPIVADSILKNIGSVIPPNVIPLTNDIPYFSTQGIAEITLPTGEIVGLSKFSFMDNALSLDVFINYSINSLPLIDFNNFPLINYALQKGYKFGIFGDNYTDINENEEIVLPNIPFTIYKAYSHLPNVVAYSDYAGYRILDEEETIKVNFKYIKKSAQIHLYHPNGQYIIHKKVKNPNEEPSKFSQSMQDLANWLNLDNPFLHQNDYCYGCENLIQKNSYNFYTLKSFAIAHNIKSIADSL